MHLVFDIFQGIGIAAAVGIRPFLPALAVGGLAAADIQIDFTHSGYSFLEGGLFLLIMVIGAVVLVLLEGRASGLALGERIVTFSLAVSSIVIGALFFAGSLDRGHYAPWPGLVGGVICAGVGILATRPLLARVRSRLDAEAAMALPFLTEGMAVLVAALSVVLPPVGIIVLIFLAWLLIAGRGRSEQKYAGLRILR